LVAKLLVDIGDVLESNVQCSGYSENYKERKKMEQNAVLFFTLFVVFGISTALYVAFQNIADVYE
jgi:hypothetical protein